MVTPGTPPIPHVGGPIIPPCAPTVLTGMMPQARVTDMCICVGPPDSIVMGSPTVLVQSLMAARIGDSTAHGGVIVMGLPTVLIGGGGGGGGGGAGSAGAGAGRDGGPIDPAAVSGGALAQSASLPAPSSQAAALQQAAANGTPFCERCATGG